MTKLEYLLMYQKADLKKQQLENAVRTTESRQKLNKITKLLREQQAAIQRLTEEAEGQKNALAKLISQQEGLSHELELNHSEMETLAAQLSPKYTVICDSAKNPADSMTIEVFKKYNANVLQTKDGDITVLSNGSVVEVTQVAN